MVGCNEEGTVVYGSAMGGAEAVERDSIFCKMGRFDLTEGRR